MTLGDISPEFRPWKESFEELVERFKKADRAEFNKPAVQEIVDASVKRKQDALQKGREARAQLQRIKNALEQSRFETQKESEISEQARMAGLWQELNARGEWVKRRLGLW